MIPASRRGAFFSEHQAAPAHSSVSCDGFFSFGEPRGCFLWLRGRKKHAFQSSCIFQTAAIAPLNSFLKIDALPPDEIAAFFASLSVFFLTVNLYEGLISQEHGSSSGQISFSPHVFSLAVVRVVKPRVKRETVWMWRR